MIPDKLGYWTSPNQPTFDAVPDVADRGFDSLRSFGGVNADTAALLDLLQSACPVQLLLWRRAAHLCDLAVKPRCRARGVKSQIAFTC